jgi:hypothetical protein
LRPDDRAGLHGLDLQLPELVDERLAAAVGTVPMGLGLGRPVGVREAVLDVDPLVIARRDERHALRGLRRVLEDLGRGDRHGASAAAHVLDHDQRRGERQRQRADRREPEAQARPPMDGARLERRARARTRPARAAPGPPTRR